MKNTPKTKQKIHKQKKQTTHNKQQTLIKTKRNDTYNIQHARQIKQQTTHNKH